MKKYIDFINEKLDVQKVGPFMQTLAKNYHFRIFFVTDQNRQATIKQTLDEYTKGGGLLPDNLQGVFYVNNLTQKQEQPIFHVEILSPNKALIKQMIDKINQSWSSFSDTENKQVGHQQGGAGWDKKTTNLGSKGTVNVSKANIEQPQWAKYIDKGKKNQLLFYVNLTLI